MAINLDKIAHVAQRAVIAGGELSLKHFRSDLNVERKPDRSLVSIADQQVEALIIRHISRSFPSHHIYAEESGGDLRNSTPLWIIDPIEGTTNFLHGIPVFGTQLAVMFQGQIVCAAMYCPISRTLISAQRGQGTQLNHQPLNLTSQPLKDSTLLFDTGRDQKLSFNFLQTGIIPHFRSFRRLGSLITDVIFMLHHRYSFYLGFSGKIYDFAPAAHILKQAGYFVFDSSFDNWQPIDTNHLFACHPQHHARLELLLRPLISNN